MPASPTQNFPVVGASGLIPAKHAAGGDIRGDGYHQAINSGFATGVFTGDPCSYDANGKVALGDGTNTGGICTAFDFVFQGCHYALSDGEPKIRPNWIAGTILADGGTAHVDTVGRTDKNVLYSVVADGVVPISALGKKANLNIVAGSLKSGKSAVTLNTASIGTGNAVVIVDIIQAADSGYTLLNGLNPGTTRLLVRNAKPY